MSSRTDFKCNLVTKNDTYVFCCHGLLKRLNAEEKKEFYQSLNNLISFCNKKLKENKDDKMVQPASK